MTSNKTSSLADSLKELLSNKNTSNRDLELLDTLHNREKYLAGEQDGKPLTPQIFYTPDEFKKTHPLFPEHKIIFPLDLFMHQYNLKDYLNGDSK